ncbi:hypothetical protein [Mycolicibacillus trivialis]|uniref:PE-PGRS family protein n=1 Tax=Mycolicibacillus trivialis TaxID=1798 RepID=A0A1X2EK25_9MYCO|nr:hypothetical protein [Mycolicibacillus trivialis]ORX03212.1 hypothetical protein AWC30_11915 [Mycolicibacillus trivialis]
MTAVTPVAAAQPLLDVEARGVHLTAVFDDLINPYSDLATNTWGNVEAIVTERFTNPAPFLSQVLDNHAGFGTGIAAAVQAGDIDALFEAVDLAPRTIAQNFLNIARALTDTSVSLDLNNLIGEIKSPPLLELLGMFFGGDPTINLIPMLQGLADDAIGSWGIQAGMPTALAIDAIGAPYHGIKALMENGAAFSDAVDAQNWQAAATTLLTSPATTTDAFLNGQGISIFDVLGFLGLDAGQLDSLPTIDLPAVNGIPFPNPNYNLLTDPLSHALLTARGDLGSIGVKSIDANFPLNGLLAPMQNPYIGATLSYTGGTVTFDEIAPVVVPKVCVPLFGCTGGYTIPGLSPEPMNFLGGDINLAPEYTGTKFGGLVPALVNWAPQELAKEINGTIPGPWSDIMTEFGELPEHVWNNFQLTWLLGEQGWLGMLTSALGLDSLGLDFPALGSLLDVGSLGGLLDPAVLGIDLVPNLAGALLGF